MTTNFPTSVDAFTNPTSGDTLDNPPHDQQHADINDAMEAVQTSLLDGAPLHIDDANERVGIGTASPSTTLDVAGAVSADGFVYVGAFDALEGGELQLDKGTSGSHHFRLDNYNDNGRFLSSTAVMANINLSTHRLDVYGDINSQTDVLVGGSSLPRGYVAGGYYSSTDSYVGTSAVNVASFTATTQTNRRYHIYANTFMYDNTAGCFGIMQINNQSASAILQQTQGLLSTTSLGRESMVASGFFTGTGSSQTFILYCWTSTGNAYVSRSSSRGIVFYLEDIGEV